MQFLHSTHLDTYSLQLTDTLWRRSSDWPPVWTCSDDTQRSLPIQDRRCGEGGPFSQQLPGNRVPVQARSASQHALGENEWNDDVRGNHNGDAQKRRKDSTCGLHMRREYFAGLFPQLSRSDWRNWREDPCGNPRRTWRWCQAILHDFPRGEGIASRCGWNGITCTRGKLSCSLF